MFGKVLITGKLKVETGLHIGGSEEFAAIGAIDSPVVRDTYTNLPMIPGSSLKGKMRSLLAKQYNGGVPSDKPDGDCEEIRRLFGAMKKPSRLIFSDMVLSNEAQLQAEGIYRPTEVKFENTIGRLTGVANPRQIERTIRGSEFDLSIVYNVEKEEEVEEDFEMFVNGLKLLSYDYLGGHGSRGYGKVRFSNLEMDVVVGDFDEQVKEHCEKILKEVDHAI